MPALIQVMQVERRANTLLDTVGSTRQSAMASMILVGILLAMCAFYATSLMSRIAPRPGVLLVALLPWVISCINSYATHASFSYQTLVYPTVVIFLGAIKPTIWPLRTLAHATVAIAGGSILMALLVPGRAFLHGYSGNISLAEKAIIGDNLLAGPFNHSNILGVMLGLGVPTIFLMRRKGARLLGFAVVFWALLWSASRTGLVAGGVGMATYWIISMLRKGRVRSGLSCAILLAASALAILIPVSTDDPTAFSLRGQIWLGSAEYLTGNYLTGNGYSWYSAISAEENSLIDIAFNGHNLYVHMMSTGGLVLTASVAMLLILASVRATQYARLGINFPAAYMATFFVTACLEVAGRFRDFDSMFPIAIIPILVICVSRPREAVRPQTRGRTAIARLDDSSHRVPPA
ncbi:O-antigen ligase [Paeniglutamicibacter sp. Y32M11]|uniref:O-antigen ligase family protein n=1 Tax=Paeniglutamicibacter sp. Y32M11 TaxID=2853258 RepID=UPI001C52D651|nr:hypothetical protein [Paeniglutamicibacter sp. Y32M11]QXQ09618.1 hypothetical protein KUF55_14275 [Paeniglutamicibacter sp. Y32M11]